MLKQLLITRRRDEANKQLAELREKDKGFEQRKADMIKREAELEAAIDEVDENTPEEDRKAVEDAVAEFENEQKTFEGEVADHENQRTELERKIKEMDDELAELNARAKKPAQDTHEEARKDERNMDKRTKFFGMTIQERDAFLGRQDIKDFLQRVREMGKRASAIVGKELLIPEVGLELLRDQIGEYSRLINRVNLRRVSGKARQRIMGMVPEGVWTEMCAKLNELTLSFNEIDVDGYKVGGYIAVCNAVLEDSDIALATEIFSALGQAIGMALDKAILFGTGTKMPMGIATRLVQTEQPDAESSNAPEWKELSTSNVITITAESSGIKFFQALLSASGKARSRYATGGKFWAMTEGTYMTLMSEAMSINASGAIVSGMNYTMPVVGGDVVIMSDNVMNDGTIIGGYGNMYLLVERAGTSMAQSEHVRFIEDETVFKATARYDGRPVMGEGFVAVGLGAAPQTSAAFAPDTANAESD